MSGVKLEYAMEYPDMHAHQIGRMLRALGHNLAQAGPAQGISKDAYELTGLGELIEYLGEVLCDAVDGTRYLKVHSGAQGKQILELLQKTEAPE